MSSSRTQQHHHHHHHQQQQQQQHHLDHRADQFSVSSSSSLPAPIPSHHRSLPQSLSPSLSSSPSISGLNPMEASSSSIISIRSASPSRSSSILSSLFSVFPLSFSPPLPSSAAGAATHSPSLSGTEFRYHSSGVEDDFELIEERTRREEGYLDDDSDEEQQGQSLDTRDMFIDPEYDRTKLEGKLSLSWLEQEARSKHQHHRNGPRSPPLLAEKPTSVPNCQPIQIPSSASVSPPASYKTSSSLFSRSSSLSSSAPTDPTPLFTSLLNKQRSNTTSPTASQNHTTIPSSYAISAPVQIGTCNLANASKNRCTFNLSPSPASPPVPGSSGPLFTSKTVNNKKKNKKNRLQQAQAGIASMTLDSTVGNVPGADSTIFCIGTSATGDLLVESEKKAKQSKKLGKTKSVV